MHGIFLFLLNMSISACPLILAVILLRFVLTKAPKSIRLILWAMVGIRLLCPITVESVFSLALPSDTVSSGYVSVQTANDEGKTDIGNAVINVPNDSVAYYAPAFSEPTAPVHQYSDDTYTTAQPEKAESAAASSAPVHSRNGIPTALAYVWLAGLAAMGTYAIWSYLAIRKRTDARIRLRDNIYACDDIESPFVMGFVHPVVMVPSGTEERQLAYIEAHEKAHIANGDHLWKPLGFALLAAYWFNPLVWLSYVLFCRDLEYACDERVIRAMDISAKQEYTRTLLQYSTNSRGMAVCPVAFGEVGVKDRVREVLRYKKPALWIIATAVAVCVIAGVCFMTSPVNTTIDSETEAYLHQVILEHGNNEYTQGRYPVEDHIILKADKKGGITTVYALVWYGEYEMKDNGEIEEVSGWHIPAVITLDMEGSGYSSDYREPRDGAYYTKDIKKMFPLYLREKAMNIHKYSDEQGGRCMEQARRHFMSGNGSEVSAGTVTMQNADLQLIADVPDMAYPKEGDYLTLHQALHCVSSAGEMIRGWAEASNGGDVSEEIYCWPYAGYEAGECTYFGDGTPCENWKNEPRSYSLVFHNDSSRESFLGGEPRPAWLISVYDPASEDKYTEIIYVDAQTGDMYNSSKRGGYMPSPYTERSEYSRIYFAEVYKE